MDSFAGWWHTWVGLLSLAWLVVMAAVGIGAAIGVTRHWWQRRDERKQVQARLLEEFGTRGEQKDLRVVVAAWPEILLALKGHTKLGWLGFVDSRPLKVREAVLTVAVANEAKADHLKKGPFVHLLAEVIAGVTGTDFEVKVVSPLPNADRADGWADLTQAPTKAGSGAGHRPP